MVLIFSLEFHSASVSEKGQKVSIKVFTECKVTVLINVSQLDTDILLGLGPVGVEDVVVLVHGDGLTVQRDGRVEVSSLTS